MKYELCVVRRISVGTLEAEVALRVDCSGGFNDTSPGDIAVDRAVTLEQRVGTSNERCFGRRNIECSLIEFENSLHAHRFGHGRVRGT